MPRLTFIDSLRGLSIVWVVLFHMLYIPVPNPEIPAWARPWVARGDMGVTLFFIISAFSLCYTMGHYRGHDRSLLSFYLRRFIRIAPLYYVLLLVHIYRGWRYYTHGKNRLDISDWSANLLFVFNLFADNQVGIVWACWAIGVLAIFYLIFPLLYQFFDNIWKCLVLVVLTLLLAHALEPILGRQYFQWSFLRHLPMFAIGMLVFYALNRIAEIRGKRIIGAALMCLSLLFFVLLLRRDLISYYWQGLVFSSLILGLAFSPFTLIVNRSTLFLGKISYSMYLWHPLLVFWLIPYYRAVSGLTIPLSVKYAIVVTSTLALLLVISYLSNRFIEEPGAKAGKKFQHRLLAGSNSGDG
ncbi:MAG: acyltransferase [Thermodesulfobacteriota bacterium]